MPLHRGCYNRLAMAEDHGEPPWRGPILLSPSLRRYAWGDAAFLPELLGFPADGGPVAEAWYGAHPSAPAEARLGTDARPCDALVADAHAGPAILGPDVAARFGGLPYLLKVLAAARPLSIQVHPDAVQARAGHDREEARGIPRDAPNRSYRDPSPKPEVLLALTPFDALCGFAPGPVRGDLLRAHAPELLDAAPDADVATPEGLRRWLEGWFALPDPRARALLTPVLGRLADRAPDDDGFPRSDLRHWVLRAHRALGGDDGAPDRGLALVFVLELVHLAPGEAMFLEAGVPHAYLEGAGIELMGSSDNVLRAGLTTKHVDPAELLRVVRFDAGRPPVLHPVPVDAGPEGHRRDAYRVPADELALERFRLTPDAPGWSFTAEGPETWLAMPSDPDARVTLRRDDGDAAAPTILSRGQACLVPHGVRLALTARGTDPVDVYRARVPTPAERPAFVAAVRRNVALADALFAGGRPPEIVGTVSGSPGAQRFWRRQLDRAHADLGAREVHSLHEDLPVNQALGLLLAWQRIRPHRRPGDGTLLAFVFGEGSRATPLTEAEGGQKPAIRSFVAVGTGADRRVLSTVELALRSFAPVERLLHRSGFEGMVVKWGDEVQIPTRDLAGTEPLLAGADVVRFVSVQRITDDTARNKDWVGVAADGRVTAFIPRRPLSEMGPLADRGLLRRGEDGALFGGINLGSVALSARLLDLLLDELGAEVNDPDADRQRRPDLDPQLFTALCIAAMPDPAARSHAWDEALRESPAMAKLARDMPDILDRLRAVLDRFEARHGRPVRMVALDFGDQYWGDIGQHRQMRAQLMALREPTADGEIARSLAGIDALPRDAHGNLRVGDTRLGPDVRVRGSVLLDAVIDQGEIVDSVLVGTRAGRLVARDAFDVGSVVRDLRLDPGSGAYRVASTAPVAAGPGERVTTVVLPDRSLLMRVHEGTDLRDRTRTYDVPILGNPLSFRDAHRLVTDADPADLDAARSALEARVRAGDGSAD